MKAGVAYAGVNQTDSSPVVPDAPLDLVERHSREQIAEWLQGHEPKRK